MGYVSTIRKKHHDDQSFKRTVNEFLSYSLEKYAKRIRSESLGTCHPVNVLTFRPERQIQCINAFVSNSIEMLRDRKEYQREMLSRGHAATKSRANYSRQKELYDGSIFHFLSIATRIKMFQLQIFLFLNKSLLPILLRRRKGNTKIIRRV